VTAVLDRSRLVAIRASVRGVRLAEETVAYVVDLIRATREHPSLAHGASPRAASMLASAARALAVLQGREFVIPDDVKELFLPTIRHRVILEPGAEVEGAEVDAVLGSILDGVSAPR
jgi:MoxR-like ATPase